MRKVKKESVLKQIFSSNKDCCSIDFEIAKENNADVQMKEATMSSDSSCCSGETK